MCILNDQKQYNLFSPRHLVTVDPTLGDEQFVEQLLSRIDRTTTMARYAAVHVDRVLSRLDKFSGKDADRALYDVIGQECTSSHKRLLSFSKNTSCVRCGRVGNVFLVEHHENDDPKQYLNLYSCSDDELVLMTVDHILPDSWFGKFDDSNFQTMCRLCNQEKQHIMTVEEIDLVRQDLSRYAKSWVDLRFLDLLLQTLKWYHTIEDAKVKAALWKMVERWRRRLKHTTQTNEVKSYLVELAQELDDTMMSFTGEHSWVQRNCDSTALLAALPASTKGSWKQKMKAWFVSAALALVGLSRTHLSSRSESPYRKLSRKSASVLE